MGTCLVGEIRAILGPEFSYRTLADFPGAPPVIEDAATFAGNASKKAVELALWLARFGFSGKPEEPIWTLADDSGLETDYLRGAPGVHSARFAALDSGAEGNSPDADNNAKLMRLLRGVPADKRTARFRCVMALAPLAAPMAENASPVCLANEAELETELFDGACEGRIIESPRGGGGFGYDPLFIPEGFEQSFAELGDAAKNQISHRAKALWKLRAWLEQQGRAKTKI